MKALIATLALFTLAVSAQAADEKKPDAAAKPASAVKAKADAASTQQNKMKQCNADAKGKKGDERKTFMKECLSKKA